MKEAASTAQAAAIFCMKNAPTQYKDVLALQVDCVIIGESG